MSINVDTELCSGCASCVDSCPYGAIELENDKAKILANCNLCGACVDVCPEEAITIERGKKGSEKLDISQYKGVWVIAEHFKGKIHPVSFQLVGKGRELADILKTNLTLVILGDKFDDKLKDFRQYGMDEILYIRSAILKDYYSDLYVQVITELANDNKPEIILIRTNTSSARYYNLSIL